MRTDENTAPRWPKVFGSPSNAICPPAGGKCLAAYQTPLAASVQPPTNPNLLPTLKTPKAPQHSNMAASLLGWAVF